MHENYDLDLLLELVEQRKFRSLKELLSQMNEVDIAQFLGELEPEKAVLYALYHDCTEILTGDLPTPVKYKNESIKTAYKAVEKEAQTALLSRLPVLMAEEMTPWFTPTEEYRPYIKAADKLSALIKCTEERRAGNHEFDRAYDTLLQAIHEMELPEAEQFMMQFLPPFGMTLDDL